MEPLDPRQSSAPASRHFTFHVDHCNNVTMAGKEEFDLFAYIFNREGEADQPSTERQEEQLPVMDFTVDSDENAASNSTAPVIQPHQPQSNSKQSRTIQLGRLQEPDLEYEEEDEDSSDDTASSSSRRRPVKTGASRGMKGNVYSLEIMKFNQLEQKDKERAQRVLDHYRDDRRQSSVHLCSRFISGKCDYMSKDASHIFRHMKSHHPSAKHPGYKITQYPGLKDREISDFVTKTYSELKQTDPQLAEEALALYKRPQNKKKQKVHLCGLFFRGKCQYFSTNTSHVRRHMARHHSRVLPMVKIVGYPGAGGETFHKHEQMTYATTTATAISPSHQFARVSLQVNQCNSKRREFDFFDYIFNRNREAGPLQSETQEKQLPLMDLPVDSDEDDASNSKPGVIELEDKSQGRKPRRVQPARLREPTTDSEDEDEDENSSNEASSPLRRRPVKIVQEEQEVARGRRFETMTFIQLDEKDKDGAQLVLDYYRDERQRGLVHICSRFMNGECRFMSKISTNLSSHMKAHHPNEKHPGYKITEFPGFKDRKIYDLTTHHALQFTK